MLLRRREKPESKLRKQHVPWVTLRNAQHVRSAETFQRNTDAAREAWQGGSEAAGRIAQRSMEQLTKIFGLGGETVIETLQQTSGKCRQYWKALRLSPVVYKALQVS